MKRNDLLDEHLVVLSEMKEVSTDNFFFTRLTAKIDKRASFNKMDLPFKPFWVVSILTILLMMNIYMLMQPRKSNDANDNLQTLQILASSYDQQITSAVN